MDKNDLKDVYCATIQSIYDYACPLFVKMPTYLRSKIDKILKRGHRIFCNNCTCSIDTSTRTIALTRNLFTNVHKETSHTLKKFLPRYNERSGRYILDHYKSTRRLNSFFNQFAIDFNLTRR